MAEQFELNYEQEIILEAEMHATLRTLRSVLRNQIEERFGALPSALAARIDVADADQLEAALRQVVRINTSDELQL